MIGQYYVNNDRYAERLLQASCEVWCPPPKNNDRIAPRAPRNWFSLNKRKVEIEEKYFQPS